MIVLPNYHILAQIYESSNSIVYRALRESDNLPVILKVLKQDYPTPQEITRYKQEYQITRTLNLEGVVKAYDFLPYQKTFVIILEDFGGLSLRQLSLETGAKAFPLTEFLKIAVRVTDALAQIHANNIIHKDINPANIVFNPKTRQIKIIDFGISTQFSQENPTLKNPNVLEGTLAYISPEQTGRMNRLLDYRTDFYSLGVTFYELLTGQLPFETEDALELVHCHIAKTPVSPHDINSEIPQGIANIVMKLMAKTAEERYQSALGIKADLEECLNYLQTKGEVSQFTLGTQDRSGQFKISQKLYGREAEVATLLTAFERVANPPQSSLTKGGQGGVEMMLVAGYSGIGKSALVTEVHKPITEKRGYFISGKFDRFQRNIPYSAVVNAFSGLIRQLLTESEAKLTQWRKKLLAAVGSNGQIIIDVIPEVELIIGKQPVVPELGPTESQNRFNRVFSQFIRAFCKKEHPLVIFLDDLQWADSATLKLIELMMTDNETKYLFLIGAYRDNEVSATHPLMIMLERLQKQESVINSITLAPLALEHISQLIADTLHSDTDEVKPLAELVKRKTGGNPFFTNQFLKTLHSENLIAFHLPLTNGESEEGFWEWDILNIERQEITDNVLELMIGKVKKLPESTQQVLQLAACVGTVFGLNTLSIIRERSRDEIFQTLTSAIHSGSILPISELDRDLLIQTYKFLHDQVQQAAYALIDEGQKQAVHLQIGRLLLQNTASEALSEKIFEIIDHLNLGVELVSSPQEREKIAKLNLIAGKKAKSATAYAAAIDYLKAGLKLLRTDTWQSQYDLTLSLYSEAVEAAYLNGNFDEMEQLATVVKNNARQILDRVKIYDSKIQAAVSQGNLKEAIQVGLEVLKQLGISLPEQPSQLDIQKAFKETASLYARREIETLILLSPMTEPEPQAAIHLMSSICVAAYAAAPELMVLLVISQVNLSIKHGHATCAIFGYVAYGALLCGIFQDIESGYKFGRLALDLVEQFNATKNKAEVFEVFGGHVLFWKKHLRETIPILSEGYQSGADTGDFEYASGCAFFRCNHSYFFGHELAELERETAAYSKAISQLRRENFLNWTATGWQAVLNLLGCAENPCKLMGDAYNENQSLPRAIETNDRCELCFLYLHKLILSYLFGDDRQAIKNAAIAEQYLDGVIAMLAVPMFYFYDSLAHLGVFAEASNSDEKALLDRINSNQAKMQNWAHHAPMNFLHKYHLVEAEKTRVLGQVIEAEEFYEQAIVGARENEYLQEEALAYELAAKFYLERGRERIAQTYMKEAHYTYTRWGAKAKVEDLEAKYSQLLPQSSTTKSVTSATTTSRATTGSQSCELLDLGSVMKASQTIAGEIVLEKLLNNLMRISIENAGAQTGFLILEKAGKWFIEASGNVDCDRVTVLQSISLDSSLPVSLVNYVTRTRETVVKNDAANEGRFTNDPYIKTNQTKSILCAPLMNQGQLSGIVYLENNLATGAFTPDRLEVIQLLSGQAAIAIDNARLYNNLEQKVQERTEQLQNKNEELAVTLEQLQTTQKQLVESEKMSALGGLVAGIAHEVNTPLGIGVAATSHLSDKTASLIQAYRVGKMKKSHLEQFLDTTERSTQLLLEHLNQAAGLIQSFKQVAVDQSSEARRAFKLKEYLQAVMISLQPKLQGTRHQIEIRGEESLIIESYPGAISQIITNFLTNSLIHAYDTGERGKIQLDFSRIEERIILKYTDDGKGIAPEHKEQIFNPFFTTARGQGGSGLGLHIVYNLVTQKLGGTIECESQLGVGTTFAIQFPAGEADFF
ncbi:MAG: AAA family ATPase [Cyanobacteriota bacterium]|nr:AAA family ATPase [Cyanobacteriota bacterium]